MLGIEVTEEDGMLSLHITGGSEILIYPKPDHTPTTLTVLNFPVHDIEQAVDDPVARGVQIERYDGMD